jgi:hypothetical protein
MMYPQLVKTKLIMTADFKHQKPQKVQVFQKQPTKFSTQLFEKKNH